MLARKKESAEKLRLKEMKGLRFFPCSKSSRFRNNLKILFCSLTYSIISLIKTKTKQNKNNCARIGNNKIFLHKWIKKVWYGHIMKYYSEIKRNEWLSDKNTWMDLKCILLCKISLSERLHMVWFQSYDVLENTKLIETLKRSIVSRDSKPGSGAVNR